MRIAAKIEYNGTHYHGWQWQKALATVQDAVEQAFSVVANESIRIVCAGRTDAGVHAVGQIIHFDTDVHRSRHAWIFGANANLPHDICVRWAVVTSKDFHARFSALARRYQYRIYNNPIRPAINWPHVTWQWLPLDVEMMHQAAQQLVGEHDFNAFRAKNCQAKSPIRTIEFLTVTRSEDIVCIDIKANAFLHHMVRNIAGVLMAIGTGKATMDWIPALLLSKNRADGGVTASPKGLYFMQVGYPGKFSFTEKS